MFLPLWILAISVMITQDNLSDEQAVRNVLHGFSEERNAKDAPAATAFFTADADFATSRGERIEGRKNIEKRLAAAFASVPHMKSVFREHSVSVRMVSADCALADFRWELSGLMDENGKASPIRNGAATTVLVKKQGKWLITAWRSMVPVLD